MFQLDVDKSIQLNNILTSYFICAGTIVKHLQATDQDGGVEGQIVYILAGWSENRGFEITYNTGLSNYFRLKKND